MQKIRLILYGFTFFFSTSFLYQHDWFLFESNNFSVIFPKKPETEITTTPSDLGDLKVEILTYDGSMNNDENYLYAIAISEYPDSMINSSITSKLETFFKNSIDETVKNLQGKLLSEKNIEIKEFPGKEIRVDYGNGLAIIMMRLYLVHNKVYILQTITETSKESNSSVLKFHNSFKLK